MHVFESLCQLLVIHVYICYHHLFFWLWAVINAQSASLRSLVATEHIAAALAPYMRNAAAAANSVEQAAIDVVVEDIIFG